MPPASVGSISISAAPVRAVPEHLSNRINAETSSTGPIYRVGVLRRYLIGHPDLEIPEFQYLSDEDWLHAAASLDTQNEASVRFAISQLRLVSKQELLPLIREAMNAFRIGHGVYPVSAGQLNEIIHEPGIEHVLSRYRLIVDSDHWQMKESVVADSWYDFSMEFDGTSAAFHATGIGSEVESAFRKYVTANKREPENSAEIQAFLPKNIPAEILDAMFYATKKRRSA